LALAIEEFERFVELMGRLGSYAGLYYAANQADPERAKFYGDISEKLTAISTEIIFFDLELNQIDEAVMAKALQNPRLARYKPWIDNVRKEKPYQLEEKIELLFHEKGQTSGAAWDRLFSETMTALRFPVEGEKEPLPLEMTLNCVSPLEERRGAAAEAQPRCSRTTSACSRSHQYTRQDKEISDRWRDSKTSQKAATRQSGRGGRRRCARLERAEAYPRLSHRTR
jgi:oligoendopeptidase F